MATLGQAVCALEEQWFVGRTQELRIFEQWLSASDASTPEILNVCGPGGIGKTALLTAFRRVARSAGREVVLADARAFSAAPGELLEALGGGPIEAVVRRLNECQPVLLLDGVEDTGGRESALRERLLAHLDARIRVVVGSRRSLSQLWANDALWHQLVRPLLLAGLPPDDIRAYLARRGVTDARLVEQILGLTRGHPLGVSLAADVALRRRLTPLDAAPEWHLAVRSLVNRLLDDHEAALREFLETASILRQFDEATLVAVSGHRGEGLTPFANLCDLSIVQPTQHGLALHEDIRRIVADDLRWRDPSRYATLRERAVAYYRERTRSAPPVERARLVCDWLFLSEQHRLRTALFGDDPSGEVHVDVGQPGDHAAVQGAWRRWLGEPAATSGDGLDPLLAWAGTRLRVARDQRGSVLGFGAFVPVSASTLPMLQQHAGLVGTVRAFLAGASDGLGGGTAYVVCHALCHAQAARAEAPQAATLSALLRDSLELLVQGGVHLACCSSPHQKLALQSLGFEPFATTPGMPLQGFVLNLSRTEYHTWVDAVAAGRPLQRRLGIADLERELRSILPRLLDDDSLRTSRLWESSALASVASDRSPADLRAVLGSTLSRLEGPPNTADHLAFRAVQLAYMTPRLTHESAAERLAVSRATFYRLLKRGIRGLASALSAE